MSCLPNGAVSGPQNQTTAPTQAAAPACRLPSHKTHPNSFSTSSQASTLQADCLQPFDIESDPPFDVLNDAHFRLALRTAASGILGALWSSSSFASLGPKHFARLRAWMGSLPTRLPSKRGWTPAQKYIAGPGKCYYSKRDRQPDRNGTAPLLDGVASARQRDLPSRNRCALRARGCLRARHGLLQVVGHVRLFPVQSQPSMHLRACHKTIAGLTSTATHMSAP